MENVLQRPCLLPDEFSLPLDPVLRRIYLARGINTDEALQLELAGLHHPRQMLNIDTGVRLLYEQLQQGGRILVVGDFDADGATSSALTVLCLRNMGFGSVDYLVPNRFEYGYGLTPEIVGVAQQRKPDLIVTVDNGVASHEGVECARQHGIKVLVTDHHLPAETLPEADCILNPNLRECSFPSKALAGVGVVFYLMLALRSFLREQGWFADRGIAEPNLASFLDIVALGTVADVVPLDQNNRRLVHHGLNVIRSGRGRPGIRLLLELAGKQYSSVTASDLGFVVGPRLNAAGRLDDMSVGIECLLAATEHQARALAVQLDAYNRDRRNIEQDMQEQALALLEHTGLEADSDSPGICLYQPEWHQGVIGILASRLKERFHRPVIAFADAGSGDDGSLLIKGSARSIRGLHIRDLLDIVAKRRPEVLSSFGGHAMAAGLTLQKADFESFRETFQSVLQEHVSPELLEEKRYSDGELMGQYLSLDFARQLQEAGPWGQHFPEPCFHGRFQVLDQRVLAERHLKLVLSVPGNDMAIDAIAFNLDASLLARQLENVDVLYRLEVNEFRGNCKPQLMIELLEPVG